MTGEDFAIGVKAFIAKDGKVLMIRRSSYTKHNSGKWDIPGGRLGHAENPIEGLKRETKEETNMDIEVVAPLHVDHFTRQDGQIITLLIFLCKPLSSEIRLSEEHTEFEWMDIDRTDLPDWIAPAIRNYAHYK